MRTRWLTARLLPWLLSSAFTACGIPPSARSQDASTDVSTIADVDAGPLDAGAIDPDEKVCGQNDDYLTLPYGSAQLDGCTRFRGNVHLPDAYREDSLAPLQRLVRIDGRLTFFRNHGLSNLQGLEQLESIGGELSIRLDDSNGRFVSLDGLSSLREVGSLELEGNPWLRSLEGLSALEVIHGDVTIERNPALPQSEIDRLLARVRVEGTVTVSGNGE